MKDARATLLLTRPKPQSEAFLESCRARLGDVPAVISPIMDIAPSAPLPDLEPFATVIVTSGNAVRVLGDRLAGRAVRTVGEATAKLAIAHGADAVALGDDVASFLENATKVTGPAIFCHGTHSRGDLALNLRKTGLNVEEAVIYDQIAVPLSQAAQALLAGFAPVVAPVFSPRSARLLSAAPRTAPLTVVAISEAAAEAWTGVAEMHIAETPDAPAMLDKLAELF